MSARGWDEFGQRLSRLGETLQSTFRSEVLEPVVLPAGALAEAEAPVRTGNLKAHTGGRINSDTEGELYSETDYSAAVNYGTSRNTRGVGFFTNAESQMERDFPTALNRWWKNAVK